MRPQIMQIETSRLSPHAPAESPSQTVPTPQAPTEPSTPAMPTPLTLEQMQELQKQIVATLCTCFDPEVPVNIYELGLIYDVEMTDDRGHHGQNDANLSRLSRGWIVAP